MRKKSGTRKLVFHIGDHKTGTTTIQNALAAEKVHIKGKTLLYPAKIAHNYLRVQFEAKDRGAKKVPDHPGMPSLPKLAKAIKRSEADYVFLSGEHFAEIDQNVFHRVLSKHFLDEFDEFRLIAYVRPHAARILSSFAEQSKIGGLQGTQEDFHTRSLQSGRFFYYPRFKGWRDLYGDAFVLRPMVRRALEGGSLLDDFLRTAIGDVTYTVDPMPSANESLCLEDLVLIRFFQARLEKFGKPMKLSFGWDMAPALGAIPRTGVKTKIAMHKALAEKVLREYAADARAMDAEFFPDSPVMYRELEKAVDTAVPTAQPLEPEAHFTSDEIRNLAVVADLLAEMLANKDTEWLKFFRQRREDAMESLRGS